VQQQFVIIVAVGTGSRLNSEVPKQFLELNGKAIVIKTMQRFFDYNPEIRVVVVVHKNYKSYLEELIAASDLSDRSIQITIGGETRFHSVQNGLNLLPDGSAVVGIHDAARPFVSVSTIKNCFETAQVKGNAIPSVSINESMRKINGDQNFSVNRQDYKIVQTPQCFLISEIKKAFAISYDTRFTDDATVLEAAGGKINLVEGNVENIKITTPYDLLISKTLSEHE
jgi:2-C-methyl-D-erythritol 4-phosphate cytidylyltransferase